MIAWTALVACTSEPIQFPSTLEPLEQNRADWPGDGSDYPEELSTAGGDSADGDYYWGHGRAYLRHDVDAVWEASQDIDACVDRRETDEWSAEFDTRPRFDVSYNLFLTRDDVIDVSWEMVWVHERQLASPDDETLRVVVNSEKVSGSPFVGDLRGSLVLEEVEPGITSLEFVQIGTSRHRGTNFETSLSFVRDYFADIRALVKGEPLPVYDR